MAGHCIFTGAYPSPVFPVGRPGLGGRELETGSEEEGAALILDSGRMRVSWIRVPPVSGPPCARAASQGRARSGDAAMPPAPDRGHAEQAHPRRAAPRWPATGYANGHTGPDGPHEGQPVRSRAYAATWAEGQISPSAPGRTRTGIVGARSLVALRWIQRAWDWVKVRWRGRLRCSGASGAVPVHPVCSCAARARLPCGR